MSQPVLIISTGRTGTIFFSQLIGELYPVVSAYHERGFSRPFQILTNAYFAHYFPQWGLKLAWLLLKEQEIRDCQNDFHLDANCFLYGMVPILVNLHPDIKIVHIVRDPRTYVTSHLNFSRFRPTSFIANYLIPFWQPSPFLIGEISWRNYFSLTRMERYAWIWSFKNQIMESLEDIGVSYLRVQFENVFYSEQPDDVFGRITDFIGLPRKIGIRDRFRKPVNQAPKDRFPEWHGWSSAQCVKFHSVCGNRMVRYGYGNEPEWKEKLGIL